MIGITMGDANGVGPEIALKAFDEGSLTGCACIVVGDYTALAQCKEALALQTPLNRLAQISDTLNPQALNVLDAGLLQAEDLTPGEINAKVAAASRQYIVTATKLALTGSLSAICTLPVNKEAIRLSDPQFTGHTELIAGLCQQTDYTMMLASKKLTVTHVSTHVSMAKAIANVKRGRVLEVIRLTHQALAGFLEHPRIAVAGLNAHAGEGGAFGWEDLNEISPAVQDAKNMEILVEGPLPPDTVFLRASNGEFDAVVCMYHDQGHIPMKLLDFDGGVNISLGLNVIRTSVDHGTAYDIAWKGVAKTGSFVEALHYAQKLQGKP